MVVWAAAPVGVTPDVELAAEVPLSAFATFWNAWKLRPEDSSELMALDKCELKKPR